MAIECGGMTFVSHRHGPTKEPAKVISENHVYPLSLMCLGRPGLSSEGLGFSSIPRLRVLAVSGSRNLVAPFLPNPASPSAKETHMDSVIGRETLQREKRCLFHGLCTPKKERKEGLHTRCQNYFRGAAEAPNAKGVSCLGKSPAINPWSGRCDNTESICTSGLRNPENTIFSLSWIILPGPSFGTSNLIGYVCTIWAVGRGATTRKLREREKERMRERETHWVSGFPCITRHDPN